jgi:hypothetical protein
MRALVLVAIVACGGSSEPPRRASPALSAIATPRGADDVIVAQVNGRPVYGSCVASQAAAGHKTKEAALDECVAFELLAQEADARALASDPQVIEETRVALVSRVVEVAFEERYKTPADLGGVLDTFLQRTKAMRERGELRSSAYVRINLPQKGASPEAEMAARDTMARLAGHLANETGMTGAHLDAAAKAFFAGTPTKFEVAEVPYFPYRGLVPSYADALFSIAEPGRIAPVAARTLWGWDVIMLTGIVPALNLTPEEARVEAFPEARRGFFNAWVDGIGKSLGVKVVKDDKAIAKLDDGAPL